MKHRPARYPGRPSIRLPFLLLLLAAACGDPTGPGVFPPPDGPPTPLLVHRTIGWISLDPEFRQVGEFEYEEGRLVGHRFGALLEDGSIDATLRTDFLYRADGTPRGNNMYVRDHIGEWRAVRVVRYAYDPERGVPIEARIEEVDEVSGRLVTSIAGIGYDAWDRIVEIREGPRIRTFTYDAAGDITTIRSDDIRFGVQVATLTYGDAWNPFADFLPFHGTHAGIAAPEWFSLHLSVGYENAVEGEPPASTGTAVVETNEYGYPTRREYEFRNTAHQEVTTIVTEYQYLEP